MKRSLSFLSLFFGAFAMVLAFAAPALAQADDPAEVEAGKAVFESNCAGCHGVDGGGSQTGRPLTDVAAEADREKHIESVVNGIGPMPAFGDRLSAEEISASVSYVRLTFTSAAPEPEPESAAEEPELARTGVETPILLVAGGLMLAFGTALNRSARRVS